MKIDITITKAMTINTGNYENVRPEVTLTAREVDIDKSDEVHNILTELANDMFELESSKQINLLKNVRKTRPNRYAEIIESREDDINSEIQDLLKDLIDL